MIGEIRVGAKLKDIYLHASPFLLPSGSLVKKLVLLHPKKISAFIHLCSSTSLSVLLPLITNIS